MASGAAQKDRVEAPEWVHIMPRPGADGRIYSRDGRVMFVPDLQALVDVSNQELAALAAPGQAVGPVPVDADHTLYDWWEPGGPAIGWATGFELRADGVYARAEWLADGRELVESKRYRYTSGVFAWEPVNIITDEWGYVEDYEIKPTLIEGFGVTNIPALKVRAMFHMQETAKMSTAKKNILALFGLADDATLEQLETAARQRLAETNARPSLDEFVPRAEFDRVAGELAALKQTAAEQTAAAEKLERDNLLEQALRDGKITPATREFYELTMKAPGGVDAFKKFVAAAPAVAGEVKLRAPESTAPSVASLTDDELHACHVAGMDPQIYAAEKAAIAAKRRGARAA